MESRETHPFIEKTKTTPDFLFLATVTAVLERDDKEVIQELQKGSSESYEFPFAEAFRFLESRYPGITVEIFEEAERQLEVWRMENPNLWQNLAQTT